MMRFIRFGNGKYKFSSFSTFFIFSQVDKIPTRKAKEDFPIIYNIYFVFDHRFTVFEGARKSYEARCCWRGGGGGGVYA